MSDEWEFFKASMGGKAVYISYDHGVRNQLSELPFNYFAGFKVQLLEPNDHGLPQGEEFEKLHQIQDFLRSKIEPDEGLHVGRITTNGSRYFHFYCSLSAEAIDTLFEAVKGLYGHSVLCCYEADPERSHYWDELYPTADDWQVMQDMKVEDALKQKGDPLVEARPIQHWVYFKSSTDREMFLKSVKEHFENIEKLEDTDVDGECGLILTHIGLPDFHSMNATTLLLSRTARQYEADYDGWETEVRSNSQ